MELSNLMLDNSDSENENDSNAIQANESSGTYKFTINKMRGRFYLGRALKKFLFERKFFL